jgi:hypothetical protein
MPRPPALAALLLVCALGSAACGGDPAPRAPAKAVLLELTAPQDAAVVDSETVTIAGRVSPAASSVRVLGEDVGASGGTFSTTIDLDPGANVVDVAATAPGRRPALTAVRVVRRMPVEIPDLQGEAVDAATERLEALALRVETREGGGLIDRLLPGEPKVCRTDPQAGEKVRVRTTVTLETGKGC